LTSSVAESTAMTRIACRIWRRAENHRRNHTYEAKIPLAHCSRTAPPEQHRCMPTTLVL
jgi:hypothetical protein